MHSAVKPTTQIHTHMCYSEFNDIIRDIDAMDADVISFEASRGDLVVLDAIHDAHFETEAGPGVYDIHSPRIPSEKEIEDRIYEILDKMDVKKVWINPDCGLKTRGNAETWPSPGEPGRRRQGRARQARQVAEITELPLDEGARFM